MRCLQSPLAPLRAAGTRPQITRAPLVASSAPARLPCPAVGVLQHHASSNGVSTADPRTAQAKVSLAEHRPVVNVQQQATAHSTDALVPAPRPPSDLEVLINSRHAQDSGLRPKAVFRNLSVPQYYEMAMKLEKDSRLASTGALMANSYARKGRSPKDKRVVREAGTQEDVWWGGSSPNYPMKEDDFLVTRQRVVDYLNFVDQVFVVDAYANWDPQHRFKVRVVCTRPYHALFMHNMLIRPSKEELDSFGEPDIVIYNAGEFPANKQMPGMTSDACVALSLKHQEMAILGTQYAGEMKKGVFTAMNYLMPKRGVLSLHSGANVGAAGDVSLFFGLSGTGKTTLSADPKRPLIGDDEHCWSDKGVFNIEGGCYAKAIALKQEKEPEIWKAIRFGTVLENVAYDPHTRVVDYDSQALTENTRACYPIEHIDNARIPCMAGHPKNIMLLCCDAFGVLPPVSKLTMDQAMYWFVSGYTAKVAGTELGVTEPQATFSACFGSVFLVWHPMKYAQMLAEQMKKHGGTAWLINTGWVGGQYGVGSRISLKYTRAILDAIHSGELDKAPCTTTPVFGLQVPQVCSGVPSEVLMPETAWKDKAGFHAKLNKLGAMFAKNFEGYSDGEKYVGADMVQRMRQGGPDVDRDAVKDTQPSR